MIYTDELLTRVMASGPESVTMQGVNRAQWRVAGLESVVHVSEFSHGFGYRDQSFTISIDARFRSADGPSAKHVWTISDETLEVCWKLLRAGVYSERESSVDHARVRKHFLDGSSEMVRTA